MIDLADLVVSFAGLLKPCPGNDNRLDDWITAATAANLPHLHAFIRGLTQDRDAVLASEEDLAGTRQCHTEQTGSRNRAQDAGGDPLR